VTLGEGYHFITVRAYRHRTTGDPLFGEWRIAIYVDLQGPDFNLVSPTTTCNNDVPSVPVDFVAQSTDLSLSAMYMFLDLPATTDFIALAAGSGNLASQSLNTFTLHRTNLITGNHRLDIVAVETLPNGLKNYNHKTYTGIQSFTGSALGPGDIDANGVRDGADIYPFVQYLTGTNPTFGPAADMNCDGVIDEMDIPLFISQLLAP
jgi:alpha-amylase